MSFLGRLGSCLFDELRLRELLLKGRRRSGSIDMESGTGRRPSEHVAVVLRLRPLSQREKSAGCARVVKVPGPHAVVLTSDKGALQTSRAPARPAAGGETVNDLYACDARVAATATQQHVFEQRGCSLLDAVVVGFRATAFAYGQTGAGKTHTMIGDDATHPPPHGAADERPPPELAPPGEGLPARDPLPVCARRPRRAPRSRRRARSARTRSRPSSACA